MKERRVEIEFPESKEMGLWVDTVVIDNNPYAVVIGDDDKIYGIAFNYITLVSENF